MKQLRTHIALLALLSFAAAAPAQTVGSVTVALGEGTTNAGDTVEIPVFLTTGAEKPSVLVLFIEYDHTKLAPFLGFYEFTYTELDGTPALDEDGNAIVLTSAVRPNPALDALGKVVSTGVNPDGNQIGNLPDGVFSLAVLGLDTAIPDGEILTIAFEVLEAAQPNDSLTIRGVPADDPILIPNENGFYEEFASSASTGTGQRLTVNHTDGLVQIGCDAAETPANVTATRNRADGVLVSWTPVTDATGVPEYRVFRGALADVNTAVPIGSAWQTETSFLDITAAVPIIVGEGGCAGAPDTVVTEYYYWVKARTADVGCESAFQTLGTLGYRTLAKTLAAARALPPADTFLVLLVAGALLYARKRQQPQT